MDDTVHGILQARILEWVAFPFLLQRIFPTQGSHPGLLNCRRILYQLTHKGSPRILEWVAYPSPAIFPTHKSNQGLLHFRRIFSCFSHSVVSDSLQPGWLQHARPPCPSPTPIVYPNSCPLSWWCHLTISFSVVPFSSCLQSFQHWGLFTWVNSSHEVAKILEFQLQHSSSSEHPGLISFRMDWLDLLAVQGTLKSLLQHHTSKASILRLSSFFIVQLSHP